MANPERGARRRRDIGLAKVGRWTRYSVAAGVVVSGVLGAGIAHALPGQSATKQDSTPAKPAANGPAQAPVSTEQSPDQAPSTPVGKTHEQKRTAKRLSPPATAPSPSPSQTQHATSGGS
jgi:hypothetical protein